VDSKKKKKCHYSKAGILMYFALFFKIHDTLRLLIFESEKKFLFKLVNIVYLSGCYNRLQAVLNRTKLLHWNNSEALYFHRLHETPMFYFI